jgi:NAD(P)H-hydrate epimerase
MRLPTRLLRRKPDAHKGEFGHIFILAGSLKYSGAAVLSGLAAMRSGAGLVTLGLPKSICVPVIKIKPKETMILSLPETEEGSLSASGYAKIMNFIKGTDIAVIGPGISRNKSTLALARRLIKQVNKPMVIDADGLNALIGHLNFLRDTRYAIRDTILTPHPGEMARLLGVNIAKVQNRRKEIAKKFAQDYKVTLVLKGRNTVIADYHGNLYVNKTGNPGMSTAGTGDVLTGMIAAFLGQGLSAFEAAKYATYIHGLAGDLAAKEKTQISLVASDIIEKIPKAIKISS